MILCAHLDSKTELLNHERRRRLLAVGRVAMVLVLAGALLLAGGSLLRSETTANGVIDLALFLCIAPAAAYALAMGANLAVLLDLARRLQRGTVPLEHTSVTLLLTVGEEAQWAVANPLRFVSDLHTEPIAYTRLGDDVLRPGRAALDLLPEITDVDPQQVALAFVAHAPHLA